jgi:8-oxo-dGTP pyrophosphatase MutT (NUDIX family)
MDRAHVADLLERYAPANADDALFREQMRALLSAREPFSRRQFEPGHFTASAFVLSPERARLLLIFHKKLGLWLQPGGHIELDDTDLEQACRREVREEVGVEAMSLASPNLFDIDVHQIPAWKSDAAHRHFDVRFLFVAESELFRQSEEVGGARWVALTELESVTTDQSVLRAATKARHAPW